MSEEKKTETETELEGVVETAQEQVEESADVAEEPTAEASELQLMLEDARNKADESRENVLRLQAELENTRRRAQRDVENAHKYSLDRFVQELLPVIDSLELGLAAADQSDAAVEKIREGTELTLKMFASVLEKFGVKEINPQGDAFNPELHQAMSMQESAEHPANTVLVVMQKGYQLNERLVRPAMVVVSKQPA